MAEFVFRQISQTDRYSENEQTPNSISLPLAMDRKLACCIVFVYMRGLTPSSTLNSDFFLPLWQEKQTVHYTLHLQFCFKIK